MRIKLYSSYRNVKGVRLDAGEQDVSQELGQYLVSTGHAIQVAGNDSTALQADDDSESSDSYRDTLIAEYEELTGESPAWNIKTETLEARLEDLRV